MRYAIEVERIGRDPLIWRVMQNGRIRTWATRAAAQAHADHLDEFTNRHAEGYRMRYEVIDFAGRLGPAATLAAIRRMHRVPK